MLRVETTSNDVSSFKHHRGVDIETAPGRLKMPRSANQLWLGHESLATTEIYLHADLKMKEAALSHTVPFGVKPGRYRPSDEVLAYLESL